MVSPRAKNLLESMAKPSWADAGYVRKVAVALYVAKYGDWWSNPSPADRARIELEIQNRADKLYLADAENFLRLMGDSFVDKSGVSGVVLSRKAADRLKSILNADLVALLERQHGEAFTNELCGEIATL